MIFNKLIFVLFFFVLLCSQAFSQGVFVSLTPVNLQTPIELYESEIVEYDLVVINNEETDQKNFNARIFVDSELFLIVNNKEKKEQLVTFVSLPSKNSVKKTIMIKGHSFSNNEISINVKYGFGEDLAQAYSTSLKVIKNPLVVNARLEKTALEPLEENKLLLDLTNSSEFEIKNLKAALTVPENFENKSTPLEFSTFAVNQSVLNSVFLFNAPDDSVGENTVFVLISFEDDTGLHQIQKNFAVDIRNRDQFLLLIGGIVIILLLLSFFLGKQKKKSEQKETIEPEEEINSKEQKAPN